MYYNPYYEREHGDGGGHMGMGQERSMLTIFMKN